MKEIRCPNCNQLLIKVKNANGEIKCTRCKKVIRIIIEDDFNIIRQSQWPHSK